MNILFYGQINAKIHRLMALLDEHYPDYKVLQSDNKLKLEGTKMIVVLTSSCSLTLYEDYKNSRYADIPVLVIEDEVDAELLDQIHKSFIKGYLKKNASLETVLTAVNLILEGGVYKEPLPLHKETDKLAAEKKQRKLETDWLILSMYSKGYTAEQASKELKISIEKLEEQFAFIKEKELVSPKQTNASPT